MERMQIALRKFDPATIDDTRICLIIGKRGTGKTILARDLLWHHRTIASGICCSGTEDGNQWYQQFIPDPFVYSEFDMGAVERLVDRQRRLRKKGVSDPAFLVLDDCVEDRRIFRALFSAIVRFHTARMALVRMCSLISTRLEKFVRNMLSNRRHLAIFTLMTSQSVPALDSDLRTNVDFVFILREPIRANRERLWKAVGGIFPTFEQFNAVMDAVTNDYGCLVIDTTSKSNKIEDVAFWYKANPKRNFKMGSAAFWRCHDEPLRPRKD